MAAIFGGTAPTPAGGHDRTDYLSWVEELGNYSSTNNRRGDPNAYRPQASPHRVEIVHLPSNSGPAKDTGHPPAPSTSRWTAAAAAATTSAAAATNSAADSQHRDYQQYVSSKGWEQAKMNYLNYAASGGAGDKAGGKPGMHVTSAGTSVVPWQRYALWTVAGMSAIYLGVYLYRRQQQRQREQQEKKKHALDLNDETGYDSEEWDGGEEPQGPVPVSPLHPAPTTSSASTTATGSKIPSTAASVAAGSSSSTNVASTDQNFVLVEDKSAQRKHNDDGFDRVSSPTKQSLSQGATSQWVLTEDSKQPGQSLAPLASESLAQEAAPSQQFMVVSPAKADTTTEKDGNEVSTSSYDSTASNDGGAAPVAENATVPAAETEGNVAGYFSGWTSIFGSASSTSQ